MAALATSLGLIALFALVVWLGRIGLAANEAEWGSRWLNAVDGCNRLFCRRFHRFAFEPVPLPGEGAGLLVANHVSGLDPLLMIAACRRPVRFMIAVEQYNRFGLRWFFKAIGCIPGDRDKRPERAFRAALRALANGEIVALFPQGAIHHGHLPPRRLKGGVARLAALSGAPVYPVRVCGVRGEGHTLLAVVLRSRARLQSFAPVDCAQLDAAECLDALSMLLQNDGAAAG